MELWNITKSLSLLKTRVNLSEDYLVSAYLVGLRNNTQMHIRMFQPQTVRQCLLLGTLYKKAHPRKTFGIVVSSNKITNPVIQNKGLLQYKKESDSKANNQMSTTQDKSLTIQPKKFLSTEEMNERRSKGLCYFCDEKYSHGHYLKHKKKTQLYMMEI